MRKAEREIVTTVTLTAPSPAIGQSAQTTAARQLTVPRALKTHMHAYSRQRAHILLQAGHCCTDTYTAPTHLSQQSTAVKCITFCPVCSLTEHAHTHTHARTRTRRAPGVVGSNNSEDQVLEEEEFCFSALLLFCPSLCSLLCDLF